MTGQQTAPGLKRLRRVLSWFAGVIVAFSFFVYLTSDFWLTTLRAYFIGRTYLAGEEFGRFLPAVDEARGSHIHSYRIVRSRDRVSRPLSDPAGEAGTIQMHDLQS